MIGCETELYWVLGDCSGLTCLKNDVWLKGAMIHAALNADGFLHAWGLNLEDMFWEKMPLKKFGMHKEELCQAQGCTDGLMDNTEKKKKKKKKYALQL